MTVNAGGLYDGMVFDPYVFWEYPKEVTLLDGTKKIVSSQSEELQLATTIQPKPVDPIVEERNLLAQTVADSTRQIQELQAQISALQSQKISSKAS